MAFRLSPFVTNSCNKSVAPYLGRGIFFKLGVLNTDVSSHVTCVFGSKETRRCLNCTISQQILEMVLWVINRLTSICFVDSKSQRISKLHYWFKSYGDFCWFWLRIFLPSATSEILTWLQNVPRFLPDGLRHQTKG